MRRIFKMAKLIYHADDGREIHISGEDFIYLKTSEGEERNWEWQYIPAIYEDVNQILEDADKMYDRVKRLLPEDMEMGKLK
jgi:hypothetical protein